jgi:AcrR family transcriptional regulator
MECQMIQERGAGMSRHVSEGGSITPMPRNYGGVSPEARRQERRQRLVDAGLEVFGTRGLRQSTMRDICARARLTDRYFYESFANVQEAFEGVYTYLRTQLLARLHVAMAAVHPDEVKVAEEGLRAFFEFVREDPRRARIMLIDVLGLRYSKLGQREPDEDAYAIRPYVRLFGDFVRGLYPGVDKVDVDIEMALTMLIGMTVQSAAAWAQTGFTMSVEGLVRHNMFAWRGFDKWLRDMLAEVSTVPPDAKRLAG